MRKEIVSLMVHRTAGEEVPVPTESLQWKPHGQLKNLQTGSEIKGKEAFQSCGLTKRINLLF